MNRLFRRKSDPPVYEPLPGGSEGPDGEPIEEAFADDDHFSWIEYSIFLLLGVAMLWAWNMFLAAAPYFQRRFQSDPWILEHFQSAILSVSTISNLGSMLVLARLQARASYPRRITTSLILNIIIFTLLALSTTFFRAVSAATYLGFTLAMVLAASLATGLNQNGVFAYVSGFGRAEYTQAIMTGQAVAGVLPCIAQIVSVLSVPEPRSPESEGSGAEAGAPPKTQESATSAFSYFLTATAVSGITLLAFLYLVPRQARRVEAQRRLAIDPPSSSPSSFRPNSSTTGANHPRKHVPIWTLLSKLRWVAAAVMLCFAITMVFPVFTQGIISVRPPATSPRIFHPDAFIPLAFLFWNTGDLLGRLSTLLPSPFPSSSSPTSNPSSTPPSSPPSSSRAVSIAIGSTLTNPRTLLVLALLRLIFIPLYRLCNLRSLPPTQHAAIQSDAFYLLVVQLGFGFTNGWLGSTCMMRAPGLVDEGEREAAGGVMGLMLVGGLAAGSLGSFAVAGV